MNRPASPDGHDEDVELEIEEEDDDPGLDPEVLRRRRDLALTIVAGLLILTASVFTAAKFLRTKPRAEADVLLLTQAAVKRDMGPGLTIQFAPEGQNMTVLGPGLYRVSGMFMAVGNDGLSSYFAFDCTLQDTPNGDLQTASLKITPLF